MCYRLTVEGLDVARTVLSAICEASQTGLLAIGRRPWYSRAGTRRLLQDLRTGMSAYSKVTYTSVSSFGETGVP